jgi:hypothetical protein
MCRSVYLPRSAVMPIDPDVRGRARPARGRTGPTLSADPRTRSRRSWPRWSGAACRTAAGWRGFMRPPGIERLRGELPFTCVDADEVVFLARLQERHALAHQGVATIMRGLRLSMIASLHRRQPRRRRGHCHRCAVRTSRRPRVSRPAARSHDAVSRAVGLLIIDVNDRDQLSSLKWLADMIASQTEPSSSSPSENSV